MQEKAGYQIFADDGVIAGTGVSITLYALNIVSDSTAGTVSIYNDSQDQISDPVLTLNGTPSKGILYVFPNGMSFPVDCFVSLDDAHTTAVTAIYSRP